MCRLLQQQEGTDDVDASGLAGLSTSSHAYASACAPDDSATLSAAGSNRGQRGSSPGMAQIRARVQQLPVVVPPQELEAIRKEFFSQLAYLFSVARKMENRGFLFRLDFNGYLSGLMQDA